MIRLIYYLFAILIFIFIFSLSFVLTGNIIELPHEIILSNQRKFISPIKKILEREIDIQLPVISKKEKIPKIIFQTHKDKKYIQEDYIENLKKINEGWKYQFYIHKLVRIFSYLARNRERI